MIRGIAISGKAGSGKSTLAKALAAELGSASVVAFGDALKREVKARYGLDKNDPGGRAALIGHGEKMRRDDPLHWLFALDPAIRAAWDGERVPIIDDLRFRLEYEYLRALGFYAVRVEAHPVLRRLRIRAAGGDESIVENAGETETMLDGHPFDFRVWNDGLADNDCRGIARAILYELRDPVAA